MLVNFETGLWLVISVVSICCVTTDKLSYCCCFERTVSFFTCTPQLNYMHFYVIYIFIIRYIDLQLDNDACCWCGWNSGCKIAAEWRDVQNAWGTCQVKTRCTEGHRCHVSIWHHRRWEKCCLLEYELTSCCFTQCAISVKKTWAINQSINHVYFGHNGPYDRKTDRIEKFKNRKDIRTHNIKNRASEHKSTIINLAYTNEI